MLLEVSISMGFELDEEFSTLEEQCLAAITKARVIIADCTDLVWTVRNVEMNKTYSVDYEDGFVEEI